MDSDATVLLPLWIYTSKKMPQIGINMWIVCPIHGQNHCLMSIVPKTKNKTKTAPILPRRWMNKIIVCVLNAFSWSRSWYIQSLLYPRITGHSHSHVVARTRRKAWIYRENIWYSRHTAELRFVPWILEQWCSNSNPPYYLQILHLPL